MSDLRTALEELRNEVACGANYPPDPVCKKCGACVPEEPCPEYIEYIEGEVIRLRAALAQSDDGKQAALEVAQRHGGTDGDHHKAWVIDQMVRALTGDGYDQFVTDTCAGGEGPDSYFWGVGIAP
jgi:hypothetical protein